MAFPENHFVVYRGTYQFTLMFDERQVAVTRLESTASPRRKVRELSTKTHHISSLHNIELLEFIMVMLEPERSRQLNPQASVP